MRWIVQAPPDQHKVDQLTQELGIDSFLAGLLVQRGIDAFAKAKSYFRPNLNELHDPFLMKDMQQAVKRIQTAVGNHEKIMVYGDYDVDGTTSVALMSTFLTSFYPNVITYIPDRYKEGYGLSYKGIDHAVDQRCTLIIALDCGVKAIEKVDYATEKGIDFIICDHHRPGKKLPQAIAVLDPKRSDCSYPYDELCGCGVGFKLCQAITIENDWDFDILIPYLDLVATAIGADIVPITGENRILAYHGLQIINQQPRAGFKAIIEYLKKDQLNITDVVFTIAPRINAAGRMKHATYAVELMTTVDKQQAQSIAKEIEEFNTDRKETEQLITQQAIQQVVDNNEQGRSTTVVYQEDWHKGVIGIVASRLIEQYYRPTLVFTRSGDYLAASARSVSGFDVYNALEQCSEFIEQFGGHKYAAGLSLLPQNYEAFKARFEEVVCATITKESLQPKITIDSIIPLSAIQPKFYRIISQMEPFGPGNMRPVFMSQNVIDTGNARAVGQKKDHLKIQVTDPSLSRTAIDAIGFNLGKHVDHIAAGHAFDISYVLDKNTWKGNTSLQLRLKDIRF